MKKLPLLLSKTLLFKTSKLLSGQCQVCFPSNSSLNGKIMVAVFLRSPLRARLRMCSPSLHRFPAKCMHPAHEAYFVNFCIEQWEPIKAESETSWLPLHLGVIMFPSLGPPHEPATLREVLPFVRPASAPRAALYLRYEDSHGETCLVLISFFHFTALSHLSVQILTHQPHVPCALRTPASAPAALSRILSTTKVGNIP